MTLTHSYLFAFIFILATSSAAIAADRCRAYDKKTATQDTGVQHPIDSVPETGPKVDWSRAVVRALTGPIQFWRDVARDKEAVRIHERNVEELEKARSDAIKSFFELKSNYRLLRLYSEAQVEAVNQSRSVSEIQTIRETYRQTIFDLRDQAVLQEQQFENAWTTYLEKIAAIQLRIKSLRMRDDSAQPIARMIDEVSAREKEIRNESSLIESQNTLITQVETLIRNYEVAESERRLRERRIIMNDHPAWAQIAFNFEIFAKSLRVESPLLKKDDQTTLMLLVDQYRELRSFLYNEMQTGRRYLAFGARTQTDKDGLRERIQNDLEVVADIRESRNLAQFHKLIGLREALRTLSRPEMFADVSTTEIRMLRAPSIAAREQLIREALKDPVIAVQVASAAVRIKAPEIPKVPQFLGGYLTKPTAPTPPGKTNKSARAWKEYQDKHEEFREKYRKYADAYLAAKSRYESEIRAYEQARLKYRILVGLYKMSLGRQRVARQVLQAFFAIHSAPSFARSADELRESVRRQAQAGEAKLTIQQKQELKEVRQDGQATSPTSDSYTFDTTMYIYTHDPLWILSPGMARALYVRDLFNQVGAGIRSFIESESIAHSTEDLIRDAERLPTPEEVIETPAFTPPEPIPDAPSIERAPGFEPISLPPAEPPPAAEPPARIQEAIDNGTYNAPEFNQVEIGGGNDGGLGGGGAVESPVQTYTAPVETTSSMPDSPSPSSFE